MSREYYFKGIDDMLSLDERPNKLIVSNEDLDGYVTASITNLYEPIKVTDRPLYLALRGLSKKIAEINIEDLYKDKIENNERSEIKIANIQKRVRNHLNYLQILGAEKIEFKKGFLDYCTAYGLSLSAIEVGMNKPLVRLGVTVPDKQIGQMIRVEKPTFIEAYEALNSIMMDTDLFSGLVRLLKKQ